MENYFDSFPEDITKWEIIREMIDLDLDDEFRDDSYRTELSIQLLPRQDVFLFGAIPKLEQKVYTKCKECKLVFNPRHILTHKTCSKSHVSSTTQSLKKKVKSKGRSSKKKPPSPLTVTSSTAIRKSKSSSSKIFSKIPKISTISPTSSTHTATTTSTKSETRVSSTSLHTSKSNSIHSPKSSSKSISPHSPKSSSKTAINSETTASSSSSSSTSNSNSNRYKKSRKSSDSPKVTSKEFDPEVHCGVVEDNRGPCTRSITCSNHRISLAIQLRTLLPVHNKDIQQLVAEQKAGTDKELKHGTSSSYMPPNGMEEKDVFGQNTSYIPIVSTIVTSIEPAPATTYVPIMPKSSTTSIIKPTATSILTNKQLNLTDMENKSSNTIDGGYVTNIPNSTQDSAIGTVLVVYMPMSPISVVSPVEFVQIGKNVICLDSLQSTMTPPLTSNRSVFLTIPSQMNSLQPNVKLYKSHPKPVAIPTYGTKKVGGAILLSNQRVECQRNDILMAMNTKREIVNNTQGYRAISLLNHTNTSHRPNILKVKSASKVNCKRPAVDKLNNVSDSKQVRLTPSVNGFILHSDISETAEAPQSNNNNNCIQEKIALLDMK